MFHVRRIWSHRPTSWQNWYYRKLSPVSGWAFQFGQQGVAMCASGGDGTQVWPWETRKARASVSLVVAVVEGRCEERRGASGLL